MHVCTHRSSCPPLVRDNLLHPITYVRRVFTFGTLSVWLNSLCFAVPSLVSILLQLRQAASPPRSPGNTWITSEKVSFAKLTARPAF